MFTENSVKHNRQKAIDKEDSEAFYLWETVCSCGEVETVDKLIEQLYRVDTDKKDSKEAIALRFAAIRALTELRLSIDGIREYLLTATTYTE